MTVLSEVGAHSFALSLESEFLLEMDCVDIGRDDAEWTCGGRPEPDFHEVLVEVDELLAILKDPLRPRESSCGF